MLVFSPRDTNTKNQNAKKKSTNKFWKFSKIHTVFRYAHHATNTHSFQIYREDTVKPDVIEILRSWLTNPGMARRSEFFLKKLYYTTSLRLNSFKHSDNTPYFFNFWLIARLAQWLAPLAGKGKGASSTPLGEVFFSDFFHFNEKRRFGAV